MTPICRPQVSISYSTKFVGFQAQLVFDSVGILVMQTEYGGFVISAGGTHYPKSDIYWLPLLVSAGRHDRTSQVPLAPCAFPVSRETKRGQQR